MVAAGKNRTHQWHMSIHLESARISSLRLMQIDACEFLGWLPERDHHQDHYGTYAPAPYH